MLRRYLGAIACVIGAALPVHAGIVLDRATAVDAVIAELGITDPIEQAVWSSYSDHGFGAGFEGLFPAGTTIRPAKADSGNEVTLVAPMYVFMVDDDPRAAFEHDVRFVYVDATAATPNVVDGTIVAQDQSWWPVVTLPGGKTEEEIYGPYNGTSNEPAGASNPDGFVFGHLELGDGLLALPASVGLGGGGPAAQNPCGLIITGVDPNSNRANDKAFDGSADAMKQQLRNDGVPANRIQDKRHAKQSDITAAITALCNLNPPCDKIYAYIGAHGYAAQGTTEGGIELNDGSGNIENVPESKICELLKPLGDKNVPVCMFIESCHGGEFVDTLRPKFKQGIIITGADANNKTWMDNVTGAGHIGFYMWAFLRCLNSTDPAADLDGDGNVNWAEAFKWVCVGDNGKVPWGGRQWDVKTKNPVLSGLPTTYKNWTAPGSGRKYTECFYDTDNDGAYDRHDWGVDLDCDGNLDYLYLEDDKDEDGKPERKVCFYDDDDDGDFDRRVEFSDTDDDGTWDGIELCFNNNGNWEPIAFAPRRSVNRMSVQPNAGPRDGGVPVEIIGNGINWNPDTELCVILGSNVEFYKPLGPNQLFAQTQGYWEGPQDVIIIDFNPDSPSHGFDQLQNGYFYQPELRIDFVDPAHLPCELDSLLHVFGHQFNPNTQVFIEGQPLPTTFITPGELHVDVPGGLFCDQLVGVEVLNPDGSNMFAPESLLFGPPLDLLPPQILCPDPLQLTAGPTGWVPLPPFYTADGQDLSGPVLITRNTLGALSVGQTQIEFEARDASGNTTTCTSIVRVQPGGGLLGDMNCDGVVSVSDINAFVLALTDPAAYQAQFPDCDIQNGDMNGDGVVSVGDINGFVSAVTGG